MHEDRLPRAGRSPLLATIAFLLLTAAAVGLSGKSAAEKPKPVTATLTPQQAAKAARTLRENLLSDPHRPGYHFVIPEGTGMPFDPNGAIFWNGRYHLFYIFQDERGHNWGHVSSIDLCHWRHHPTKLLRGMFSGNCFVNKEGVPTMCYHQVGQGNAMAVAVDEELNDWKKLDSNPITPPTQDRAKSITANTIPGIRMAGSRAKTTTPFSEASGPGLSNRSRWPVPGNTEETCWPIRLTESNISEDVSCADFFKLGDRHMLLCISHDLGARYYLGKWERRAVPSRRITSR